MNLVKEYEIAGAKYRIKACVVLQKIGSQKPYFSVTGDIQRLSGARWRDEACGAIHEDILREFPELSDVVAMHLSDEDGVPMHAVANSFYWLVGGCFTGTRWLHVNHPYGQQASREDRIRIASGILRVDVGEGARLFEEFSIYGISPGMYAKGKEAMVNIVEEMKPRWKREADAVIAKYNLKGENQ